MPFSQTEVQRVAGAGWQGLWVYRTPDTIAVVTAAGYFNPMRDDFNQFDVIIVVSSTGATPVIDNIFITSVRGAASVTTSATEGITAT